MLRRHVKFLLAIITIFALVAVNLSLVEAAAITVASDTLTSIKATTSADHTITFTIPGGVGDFTLADSIIVDFPGSSFTETGTWAAGDFTFNDGAARTISAVEETATPDRAVVGCSDGAANVGVEIDTTAADVSFRIVPCGASFTANTSGTITFGILGAATGGIFTNPAAGSYVTVIGRDDANDGTSNDTVSIDIRIVTAANTEVSVTATVDPTLTFSLGAATVALGTLSTSSTSSGSHTALIATNGASGFTLTYNGATLTSGGNTITAMGAANTSTIGSEEFGINLRDNATPDVGATVTTNAGTCTAIAADFNTVDSFSYTASATTSLATAAAPADCVYTVSYIANIATTTEAGSYATTVTYVGTGLF